MDHFLLVNEMIDLSDEVHQLVDAFGPVVEDLIGVL